MKSKIRIMPFLIIMFVICISTKSNAAISATSTTVNSGETVSIRITSNPGVATYKVSLIDAGGLTFLSCSGGTVGGTSVADTQDKNMTSLATYNFRVPTVNSDTTYTVKFTATGMETKDLVAVADSTTNAKITVRANNSGGNTGNTGNEGNSGNQNNPGDNPNTSSKSSNAKLKSFGITPKEYDFTGFNENIYSYNAKKAVPYNVEAVEVYATAQDSKAKVTGRGIRKLKEGTNKLDVIVTAEDGTKKTYTINVTRNSEDENMTPNVVEEPPEEKPEKLSLTAIALQNDLNLSLSPVFNSEIYEYTVEVENDIQSLELSGIPNVDGAQVLIEGNENLLEGENIVTLTVKAEGYEDVVYKITVIRKEKVEEATNQEKSKEIQQVDLNNSMATIKIIIIISVIVFIVIAIILILILRKKKAKRLDVSYDDYYNDYMNEGNNERNNKEIDDNSNSETENEEISEGYTAEIGEDETYKEKSKKRKGKHF